MNRFYLYKGLSLVVFYFICLQNSLSQIFVTHLTYARPSATTYYVGDRINNSGTFFYQFEIGQSSWNASEVGVGQNTDGSTGWNWGVADYYQDGASPNKRVQRDIGNIQFTASGTWYVVGRARANSGDAWTYSEDAGWTNNQTLTLSTSTGNASYFTVTALDNPTTPAISCGSAAGEIGLSWTKWNNRDVLIIRNTTGIFTGCEPVTGTTYNAGNTIGTGANQATVVYRGGATSTSDAGLNGGTTYYYKIYSENYSYYSSGTSTLNATTFGLWTGATSTDWHTTSNWSCNTIPTATTDVIIPSGAPRYPVISTSDAVARSITLNASGTSLTMNTARKLTLSGNFSLAAGSTFDAGDGTVVFNTAATITGTITFFKVEIGGGGVAFNSNCTIGNGTNAASLTINAGGFVSTDCPIYAAASSLIYNTGASTFNRGNEWTSNLSNQPFHVRVNAGSTLNLDITASYDFETRSMRGDLDLYGALTMGGTTGSMAEDLIVGGGVTIRNGGSLTLGCQKPFDSKIGDIQLGGNWVHETGGTFDASRRAVIFNGSSTLEQTVTFSGTEVFGYFIVNKSNNGTVKMFCDSRIYGANQGSILQLLNGNLDLNGKSMTLQIRDTINNVDQNILIDGTDGNLTRRVFNSSATASYFNITHYRTNPVPAHMDTVKRNSVKLSLLTFDQNVVVTVGSSTGNVGINFGDGLTTIKGTLRIDRRGFVNRYPPTYATNSLLQYNTGEDYNRNEEWNAASGPGFPFNVQLSTSGTLLRAGGAILSSATDNRGIALNLAGSLTIDAGTTFDMTNANNHNMTVPLTVDSSINIAGTLLASQVDGGNIILGKNWNRTGAGAFTHNNRSVTFNKSIDATLFAPSLGETFYDLIINKPGIGTIGTNYVGYRVTLNSPVAITNALTLTAGYFISTTTNLLTIINTAPITTGGAVETFVSGPIRKLGSADFSFPVGRITNTGASDPEQFHYRPIAISGLGSTADYTAEFFRANPYLQGPISSAATAAGLQLISYCEYWNLTRATGTGSITVSPSWSTHNTWSSACNLDPYVVASKAVRVVPFTAVNQWGDIDFGNTSVDPGSQDYIQTISWNGALNYNKFVLGSVNWRNAALPLKIKDFNASKKQNLNQLDWAVNDNHEAALYVIERSKDGIVFVPIIRLDPSSERDYATYQQFDAAPLYGWNYYRLKVYDNAGKYLYSSVRKIYNGSNVQLQIYPNPVSNILNITLPDPSKVVSISIFNATGQRIHEIRNSSNNQAINVSAFPTGHYILRIIGTEGVSAYPFVKE
jgi:hypothetical protein